MEKVFGVDFERKAELFRQKIIEFYFRNGRRDLPWRKNPAPWRILLAELFLRKTTVAQVANIFSKLENLEPKRLCCTPVEEIQEILRPLGIYKVRSSQIRSIACAVAKEPELLQSKDRLLTLPGVGEYTANAVLCFAFSKPAPLVDTNVARILCRVFGIHPKARPHTDKKLWELAKTLLPSKLFREYNWGLIDFGSTVCLARKPLCKECCIKEICSNGGTK